jgi:hypothetical protein
MRTGYFSICRRLSTHGLRFDQHEAIADGKAFMHEWCERAEAMGWARDDLGRGKCPQGVRCPSYDLLCYAGGQ